MFKAYIPTWQIKKITDLEYSDLKNNQIETILTDLDNTIIAWDEPHGTQELKEWLNKMANANIKVIIISNNNYERVKIAADALGLPFIAAAKKPFSKGIRQAITKYHLNPATTVMVGDQLMTDIRAASGAKVRSILVKPLVETDEWKTYFNRQMEKVIKKILSKQVTFEWKDKLN